MALSWKVRASVATTKQITLIFLLKLGFPITSFKYSYYEKKKRKYRKKKQSEKSSILASQTAKTSSSYNRYYATNNYDSFLTKWCKETNDPVIDDSAYPKKFFDKNPRNSENWLHLAKKMRKIAITFSV